MGLEDTISKLSRATCAVPFTLCWYHGIIFIENGIRSYRVGIIDFSALAKALRLDNKMEVSHQDEFCPLASWLPYQVLAHCLIFYPLVSLQYDDSGFILTAKFCNIVWSYRTAGNFILREEFSLQTRWQNMEALFVVGRNEL